MKIIELSSKESKDGKRKIKVILHEIYKDKSEYNKNGNNIGWSHLWKIMTIGGTAKINIGGTWKKAIPYVKVNGVWKPTISYINVDSSWKRTQI